MRGPRRRFVGLPLLAGSPEWRREGSRPRQGHAALLRGVRHEQLVSMVGKRVRAGAVRGRRTPRGHGVPEGSEAWPVRSADPQLEVSLSINTTCSSCDNRATRRRIAGRALVFRRNRGTTSDPRMDTSILHRCKRGRMHRLKNCLSVLVLTGTCVVSSQCVPVELGRDRLTGKWAIEWNCGKETLELKVDGSYAQAIEYADGGHAGHNGTTWQVTPKDSGSKEHTSSSRTRKITALPSARSSRRRSGVIVNSRRPGNGAD